MRRLPGVVHPDAVFRSPVAFAAYHTAPALVLAISTVIQVFEDFAYHRELASDDGLNVVLEFSARVGDKKVKGIDFIQFDTQGRIVEFEVMIRPLSGLQALAAEMGARIGQQIPAFKNKTAD
ncbi:MAG: nuclear transport factor 2 family protein [Solimonas sp.]